jgi:methanogenic corrinoid protein MtbC1
MEQGDGNIGGVLVGELLRTAAGDIALDAVREMLATCPEVVARGGPQATDRWREAIGARVTDLADALSAGRPAMFVGQVTWARAAYAARGVAPDDISQSLDALARVIPRHVPEEDRELVLGYLRSARGAAGDASGPPPVLRAAAGLERVAGEYLLALLEGDRARAWEIIEAATGRGVRLAALYTGVLTPALQEVGRMWQLGEVNVAEEHFATATTLIVMSRAAALTPRAPANGRTVACSCVAGNYHEVGPRMVSDLLEVDGWRVIYLGANIPADDFALACEDFRADVAVLSGAIPSHVRSVREGISTLRGRSATKGVRVLVGGRPFDEHPDLWREVGADGHARDPEAGVREARRLVGLGA